MLGKKCLYWYVVF